MAHLLQQILSFSQQLTTDTIFFILLDQEDVAGKPRHNLDLLDRC